MATFAKTFEEHLRHINLTFKKLTTAGFTINALKCKFCQPQMRACNRIRSYISRSTEDRSNIKLSGPEKSKTFAIVSRHLRIS